jgi:hypothetical protein
MMDYFDIFPFDITALAQTLSQFLQATFSGYHDAYPRHFRWLLRLGGKAQRKEQGTNSERKDSLTHRTFPALLLTSDL